ncbi:MAG: branched-chain amino acid ABC transporter permease [Anaerolineae bacterium]|nr:branched-chain amino acid ABC transporter permease [Anaerolineae bacterium]
MQRVFRTRSARIGATVAAMVLLVAIVLYLGHAKGFGPVQYVQLILDGVRGGSIYALIALGFVVVFNVTGIINFAQGGFVMSGAMLAVAFNNLDLPLPPALQLALAVVFGVAVTTVIGALVERLTIFPARHSHTLTLIIITVGVYIFMQGMALLIWGANAYNLPAFTTLALEDQILRSGGIMLKAQSLWIWGTLAVVLVGLYFFFERTLVGKALRACAINRRAAELMGINPSRMSLLSFAMAAALGAIGGVVLSPATRPIYDMGLKLGLKGFIAAIMGGMVSSPGAVVGGILLGVLENVAAGVTRAGFKDIFAFVVLILILFFRPQGIIGGGERGVEQ